MSQLQNGTEDLVGQNLTPAAAYGAVNAALQKLAQMNIADKDVPFLGMVTDGQTRGAHQCAVQTIITAVEIRCEGDVPVTNPLTLQINVGGTLNAQVFSLGVGNNYILIPTTGSGIVVAAAVVVKVVIGSANSTSDVVVTLKKQLVVL